MFVERDLAHTAVVTSVESILRGELLHPLPLDIPFSNDALDLEGTTFEEIQSSGFLPRSQWGTAHTIPTKRS